MAWRTLFFVFCIVRLALSWPTLSAQQFLNFDDTRVVTPLATIYSLEQYFAALQSGQILDLQPVRDVSYLLDFLILRNFGIFTFHITSAVLFLFVVFSVLIALRELKVKPVYQIGGMLLFGMHPMTHASVFWISGRKHLLSGLFLAWAFIYLIRWCHMAQRKNRTLVLSGMAYTLSLLSQPIGLGFPLAAIALIDFRESKNRSVKGVYILAITMLGFVCAFVNWGYYTSRSYVFANGTPHEKIVTDSLDMIVARFHAIGRYFFQLTIPIEPSISFYRLSSPMGLIGLALIFAVAGIAYFNRRRILSNTNVGLLLLSLLPVMVVTVRMTRQGAHDAYLFGPLLFSTLLIVRVLSGIDNQISRRASAAIFAFCLFMANSTFQMSKRWASDDNLSKAALNEGTAMGRIMRAKFVLAHEKKPSEVLHLLSQMDDRLDIDVAYIAGRTLYQYELTTEVRNQIAARFASQHPWYAYFSAATAARKGDFHHADQILLASWQDNETLFRQVSRSSNDEIIKKWIQMCESASYRSCNPPGTASY